MTNRFMTSHAAGAPRRQGKRHIPGQGIRKEGVSGGGNGGAAAEWRLADTKEEEKKKHQLSSSGHSRHPKTSNKKENKKDPGKFYTYAYTKIIKKNAFH